MITAASKSATEVVVLGYSGFKLEPEDTLLSRSQGLNRYFATESLSILVNHYLGRTAIARTDKTGKLPLYLALVL
jgi:hypothetical protein